MKIDRHTRKFALLLTLCSLIPVALFAESRYTFPVGNSKWALLNSIYYAGYTPGDGPSNDLAAILTGIEYKQQLKNTSKPGGPVELHWGLSYTFLGDELTFGLPAGDIDSVDDQFEISLAYGYR